MQAPTLSGFELVWPGPAYLAGYVDALERGWSYDNSRGAVAAREELALIAENPVAFLESLVDREAKGPPITMPDGSIVPRLPGFRRWMWDGEFCGSIGLRWQHGTAALPPTCLGHIGYSVVPWKQKRGCATQALALILDDARPLGLPYVEVTTDPDNVASQRVIEKNGGLLFEQFVKPAAHHAKPGLRYRIPLG
jgi:predicted acetyltransferase